MTLRVQIVEDNAITVESLAAALRGLGYYAHWVMTGEAALSQMDVHKPDVIVADYYLAGMDGLELLRRVRARPDWAGVAFVFLTAAPADVLRRIGPEVAALAPAAILRKPAEPAEIALAIESLARRPQAGGVCRA